MDPRAWRYVTIGVVAATAALFIGGIVAVVMFKNGSIGEDSLMMILFMLSTTLTTVVIIYGVFALNSKSTAEQYKEFLENKKDEEH